MTELKTIQSFIESHGLTMLANQVDANPCMDDPSPGSMHWLCHLKRGNAFFDCYFTHGAAYRRWIRKPSAWKGELYRHSVDLLKSPPVKGAFERSESMLLNQARRECTEPIPPELPDVLDCLASDASTLDEGSFDAWASSLGYDTDSRKAEATYRTILEQSNKLRVFLGAEAYNDLLYNTERI